MWLRVDSAPQTHLRHRDVLGVHVHTFAPLRHRQHSGLLQTQPIITLQSPSREPILRLSQFPRCLFPVCSFCCPPLAWFVLFGLVSSEAFDDMKLVCFIIVIVNNDNDFLVMSPVEKGKCWEDRRPWGLGV